MTPRQIEDLEILSGSRSKNAAPLAAVRRQDLDALLAIPARLRSSQVGAAPSQADYNALQADVADLFKALSNVSASMRKVYGR